VEDLVVEVGMTFNAHVEKIKTLVLLTEDLIDNVFGIIFETLIAQYF
jgi:hypothetical protein